MEIYRILKERNARGVHRAIPCKELAVLLHTSTRQIKRWVELERRKHFICSTTRGGGGYFRPSNRAEIVEYMQRQEKLIKSHALSIRLARRLGRRNRQAERGDGV